MAVSTMTLAELLGEWRRGGPAHERLAATLRALALDGRLPLESRLPAERGARRHAGHQPRDRDRGLRSLRADGYLSSRQGSGSWLTVPGGYASGPDGIAPADGLDLRVAALPAPAALDDLARDAVADLPRWLDHHGYEPLGLPPLREAIAARFTARGLPTRPEEILVTNGALQAIDLCCARSCGVGARSWWRSPAIRRRSTRSAMPEDGFAPSRSRPHGWDLEALEATARSRQPALAYLIPDFQNPTAALMDEPARLRAVQTLERAGTAVIVDESFAELDLDGGGSPLPTAAFGRRRDHRRLAEQDGVGRPADRVGAGRPGAGAPAGVRAGDGRHGHTGARPAAGRPGVAALRRAPRRPAASRQGAPPRADRRARAPRPRLVVPVAVRRAVRVGTAAGADQHRAGRRGRRAGRARHARPSIRQRGAARGTASGCRSRSRPSSSSRRWRRSLPWPRSWWPATRPPRSWSATTRWSTTATVDAARAAAARAGLRRVIAAGPGGRV